MKKETLLATLGCQPTPHSGVVNFPPHRASTILYPSLAELRAAETAKVPEATYGRYGTPSTRALEEALAKLEGTDHAIVTASGMSAIVAALMTYLESGDHLLMVDSAYGPTRRFCDHVLKRAGVETTYYDPTIGAGIEALIQDNTKVVYLESPGSLTFEVQDVPAIAKAAHAKNITVIGDNTWGTFLHYKPFELGIDVSIHSVTKYIAGHSDLVMGCITCNADRYRDLLLNYRSLGACPTGDNCYMVLRGLRTMEVRMERQFKNALKVAEWLKEQPAVEEVLYPALPGAPGHDLWKRDFTGGASLFAIAMKGGDMNAVAAMVDDLKLFGIGYSWGGFESLIMPNNLEKSRTASTWDYSGPGIRIHIGLEHPDDLITDLKAGLERYQNALASAA
ncbi:MAG: cystathionine beta-lyase [Rickettsiales bacterium]